MINSQSKVINTKQGPKSITIIISVYVTPIKLKAYVTIFKGTSKKILLQ